MSAPTRQAGWFKCSESGWQTAVEFFPPVWPEDLARDDVAWWLRRVDRGEADRLPGRRTLAARWGWSERQVRALLADVPQAAQERPTSGPLANGSPIPFSGKRPTSGPLAIQQAAHPPAVVAVEAPTLAPLREKREENKNSYRPTLEARGEGTVANREASSAVGASAPVVGRPDGDSSPVWTGESPTREALPASLAGPLVRAGLATLGTVARYSRDEVYALTGSGPLLRRDLNTIRARLREAGLLGGRVDWDEPTARASAAPSPAEQAALAAWGQVRAAMSRYGAVRQPRVDFTFAPEERVDALIGGALLGTGRRWGWADLCRMQERDLEREARPWFLARYAERAAGVAA